MFSSNSPIDEISQLIDKNSINAIKLRQELSSNFSQENAFLKPTNEGPINSVPVIRYSVKL